MIIPIIALIKKKKVYDKALSLILQFICRVQLMILPQMHNSIIIKYLCSIYSQNITIYIKLHVKL